MSKFQKFIVGFDLHGDMADKRTNEVFFKFVEQWKPEIRICGGDLWDFRPLRKGAGDDERRQSMQKDFDCGMEWFDKLSPQYFIRGNHDERLWELAESSDHARADLAQILIHGKKGDDQYCVKAMLKRNNTRMLPYHKRDGVLRLGSLKVVHGFYCGLNATRQHGLTYGSCLFGHVHTIDECAVPGLERRVSRACGALCRLDMEYNARQPNTLRQANGFPFGIINKSTGHYHVWQAESVDGKWILPSDFCEL